MKRSFAVLGFVLLASAAAGEQLELDLDLELDLERVVALALERNPGLLAVEARREEVAQGIREARGDAFPEVELVSSWSRLRNPALLNSPDFSEFVDQFPGGTFVPAEQELYRLALEVRQAVFTSGKTGAAVQLARVVADVAQAQIAVARLDTALAAAEAYYRLLASREALATVEVQQRVREEALAVVEARYEIGEATELERLRSRAALAALAPDLASLRGRQQVAAQTLRAVLDLPADIVIEATEEASEPPPSEPLAALLATALDERPELADLELQREALGEQQRITRADGRPQVSFAGAYGREVRLPEDFSDDLFQDWRVGLAMRWELFDGGSRKAELARIESQREQLALQRRELANRVRLEIETARTARETARERWRAAAVALEAASEASRVASESYREGVALQADLLDAQQQEILAGLDRVAAFYDALIESARLERAVGRLPTGAAPGGGGSARPAEGRQPAEENEE